jgi:hypothetical protein
MNLPVHHSEILFENDDLKKLDPEIFRVEIQKPFIKSKHIAEMKVRVNDQEQTVLLAISNPPIFGSIDHQDTMLIKFPLQEVFEMLKCAMRQRKLRIIAILGRLRVRNYNHNSLNE